MAGRERLKNHDFKKPPRKHGYKAVVSYSQTESGGLLQNVSYVPKQHMLTVRKSTYTISTSGILKSILLILLIVSVFSALRGRASYISFTSFLEVLQTAPEIPTKWISFGGVISDLDLPSWLFWLRPILSFFIETAEMLMFFVVGLSQVITYVVYFLGIFFK